MGQGIVSKYAFLPPPSEDLNNYPIKIPSGKNHKIPVFECGNKSTDPEDNYVLIFSHGNAEDLSGIQQWLEILNKALGIPVIGYDYSGYGESINEKTKQRILDPQEHYAYENIRAVFNYVLDKYKIAQDGQEFPPKIILMGRSLGSGPTCYMAMPKNDHGSNVVGVILQSPLMSAIRVVMKCYFTLPFDIFPNIDRVGKFQVPTFVVHGQLDQVISWEHGKQIYDSLPDKVDDQPLKHPDPWWINDSGHNDIEYNHLQKYLEKLKDFVTRVKSGDLKPPVPKKPRSSSTQKSFISESFPSEGKEEVKE